MYDCMLSFRPGSDLRTECPKNHCLHYTSMKTFPKIFINISGKEFVEYLAPKIQLFTFGEYCLLKN